MATEAPSAVDADESPQSVVDAVAAHLAQLASPPGAAAPARNGAAAAPDAGDAPGRNGWPGHGPVVDGWRDGAARGIPNGVPQPVGGQPVGAVAAEHLAAGPADAGLTQAGPADAGALPAGGADAQSGPEPAPDAPHFAAAAVLDVLRASGWADAAEARRLRAEADRLRELLDLVVRDHRAREATAVGVENKQAYWLVPLLRAAHGVAFGSLGAKLSLRTAVQAVPQQILAAAGLRIDYGVEHSGAEPAQERAQER